MHSLESQINGLLIKITKKLEHCIQMLLLLKYFEHVVYLELIEIGNKNSPNEDITSACRLRRVS